MKLQTLSDLDQRTSAYRAAVKLRDEMVDDAGGIDTLSAVKIKLIESVATMTAVIDHYHSLILAGDPQAVPIGELATLTNTRNRTAAMVGLGKSVKTLDLKTYMAETYGDAR
ncbi:hypothetical protein N2597_04345 [Rhizobium sophoriradicis]|uniref:hypothetical protein n=1 Tax=Rhizobium sophoriradicis TaxID=1535245 RepID=UPI0016119A32|nr:hypothetical protein N2597_04345 [Rhizobium leguminosarum bv. phaseoli]